MQNNKPKLGISISMVWAIRNIIHSGLMEQLCSRFDVHVLFRLPAPSIEKICCEKGAMTWSIPELNGHSNTHLYKRTLNALNQSHKAKFGFQSEKYKQDLLRRNYSTVQRLKLLMRDGIFSAIGRSAGYPLLANLEKTLFKRVYDVGPIVNYLSEHDIDLVLLTAPLQQESQEASLMRACLQAKIPIAALVLGFDNLTTKGRLLEIPDYFLAWNERMRKEILEIYPGVGESRVFISGSPQFDFYADSSWGYTRVQFCEQLGLDPRFPIMLYSANPQFLVPYEHLLVEDLIKRVQNDTALKNLQFIVRLHPFDLTSSRWKTVGNIPGVVLNRPWSVKDNGSWGNIATEDIHLLAGSLKHSACVVNVSSTMALDAAFYDRPVIAPAYDVSAENGLSRHIRLLYEREHYLPITNSGAITLVHSPVEAIEAIKLAIEAPERKHQARKELTEEMLGKPVGSARNAIADALLKIVKKYPTSLRTSSNTSHNRLNL